MSSFRFRFKMINQRRISIPMDRTIERIPAVNCQYNKYVLVFLIKSNLKPFRSDLSSTHTNEFHDKVKEYSQSLKSTRLIATE